MDLVIWFFHGSLSPSPAPSPSLDFFLSLLGFSCMFFYDQPAFGPGGNADGRERDLPLSTVQVEAQAAFCGLRGFHGRWI